MSLESELLEVGKDVRSIIYKYCDQYDKYALLYTNDIFQRELRPISFIQENVDIILEMSKEWVTWFADSLAISMSKTERNDVCFNICLKAIQNYDNYILDLYLKYVTDDHGIYNLMKAIVMLKYINETHMDRAFELFKIVMDKKAPWHGFLHRSKFIDKILAFGIANSCFLMVDKIINTYGPPKRFPGLIGLPYFDHIYFNKFHYIPTKTMMKIEFPLQVAIATTGGAFISLSTIFILGKTINFFRS